ncbi:MAG: DUF2807 domain-containing protein [Hyphomonadaceae bacterium]|nr:DUF2807 domain-containing protein [Hyphomonadaceae bacterium]
MRAPFLLASAGLFILAAAGPLASPAAAEASEAFSRVEAEGRFKVDVATGAAHGVEVVGDDAGRVEVRVRGGELQLRQTGGFAFFGPPKLDAVVRVTAPAIGAIEASRGARITADVGGGDLSVIAAQGGMVTVRAGTRPRLEAKAAMGGIVEVSGTCERLEASASMGGIVDAEGLACAEVRAEASMGGVIEAQASQVGDASASMGGSVEIAGAPERRTSRASMGGDVSFH